MLTILLWIVPVLTSLWVAVDSRILKLPVTKKPYGLNNGCVAWFLSCLFLWIFTFPLYLWRRHEFLKLQYEQEVRIASEFACPSCSAEMAVRTEQLGAVVACHACGQKIQVTNPQCRKVLGMGEALVTTLGLGSCAAFIVVGVLLFTGDIKVDSADLSAQVKAEFETRLHSTPEGREVEVNSLILTHVSGNDYKGAVEVTAEGENYQIPITTTCDGKSFFYETGKPAVTTEQLSRMISKLLLSRFAKNSAMKEVTIASLNVVHVEGNKYRGIADLRQGNETSPLKFNATFDGFMFLFELVEPVE